MANEFRPPLLPPTSLWPPLALERPALQDFDSALQSEWLVTNGLGGYASSTVLGVDTRRYHGLLMAALQPPVGRTLLLACIQEEVEGDSVRFPLFSAEYHDGTVHPNGYLFLERFQLDGTLPVWHYRCAGVELEKTLWLEHGRNTVFVRYRLLAAPGRVRLRLEPFVTHRDYHAHTHGDRTWRFGLEPLADGCRVEAFPGATGLWMHVRGARFEETGMWYWRFLHRRERERGLDDLEDLYTPGAFHVSLAPGETTTLVASIHQEDLALDATLSIERERERQRELVSRAELKADDAQAVAPGRTEADPAWVAGRPLVPSAGSGQALRQAQDERTPWPRVQPEGQDEGAPGNAAVAAGLMGDRPENPVRARLVLAADQFLVSRGATGRTVIAGYHWFTDWGRDTMIALPGLCLATGRADETRDILATFAAHIDHGLIPNRFPDGGEAPEYTAVDATLWLFEALARYERATGDQTLVDALLPALREVVAWHRQGTHGIRFDPTDGLLRAGAPGVALTWMDARVGEWVVTPRQGKPVEIQGLWYNALCLLADWLAERGEESGETFASADRCRASFNQRFWEPGRGYCHDVVDGPEGDDPALRPNQLLAASLSHPVLEPSRWGPMLEAIERTLLTPVGLRTLARGEPGYVGSYSGDQLRRDGAYHQGTAWPWLLGPYVDVARRARGDTWDVWPALEGLAQHLNEAGLGQVSEAFGGDPPHPPGGCIAQAWSVAELLRVWPRA